MVPLEMYAYYINYSGNTPLNFIGYYFQIYLGIGGEPKGFINNFRFPEMNFGHLWFTEHLLFYAILYTLISYLLPKLSIPFSKLPITIQTLLGLASSISLLTVVVRQFFPIDSWVWVFGFLQSEVAHLPQYAILFVTGIIAYSNDWFSKITKQTGYGSLGIGIFLTIPIFLRNLLPADYYTTIINIWSVYESFVAVFLSWGLITLFREKCNTASNFSKILAENSYAAFILHFPIVFAVQYYLEKIPLRNAEFRFILVSIVSVVVTYACSTLIRKIPIVRKVV